VPSRRARGGSQSAGVRPDAVVLLCQSFSPPSLQYKQAVQDRHIAAYQKLRTAGHGFSSGSASTA
jgi:hypothetical protein